MVLFVVGLFNKHLPSVLPVVLVTGFMSKSTDSIIGYCNLIHQVEIIRSNNSDKNFHSDHLLVDFCKY